MPINIAPAGTPMVALAVGMPTVVINAMPNGTTGVTGGAAQYVQPFSVQPRADNADRDVTLLAQPNGTVTTFTADLEVSGDGGNAWQKNKTGIALIASSVSTESVVTLQAGYQYRLNASTNSGGTSVTVIATQ